MDISKIAAILVAAVVIFGSVFFLWHFYFSIYELKPVISPAQKIVSGTEVAIRYIPINVWGRRVPFRSFNVEFKVVRNGSLIKSGTFVVDGQGAKFVAGDSTGVIEIHSNSNYFLSTNIIKIEIGENNE